MAAMLSAMAAVLGMWILVGGTLVGMGLIWRKAIGSDESRRPATGNDFFLAFWVGFAILLFILQIWHLFLPITGLTLGIVAVIGWVGLLGHVRDLGRLASEHRRSLIVLTCIALWLANRAIGPGNAEDSGLYHYRAVRWAHEFALVPGIGNLSAPLALNNVSFLYNAMLEAGPWHGRSNHLSNGLLLVGLFAGIVMGGARLMRGDRKYLAMDAYLLTLLPVAVYLALGKDVSSPKTDLPVGFMTFIVGYAALPSIIDRTDRPNARRFDLITLALLASAAICLKFSSVVVVTLIGIVAFIAWIRSDYPRRRDISMTLATIAGCVIAMLVPWVGRNIVMSGYPLYPSKIAPVAVEWKVPEPAVDYLIGSIRNQAKAGLILWAYDNLKNSPFAPYARLMKPSFTDRDNVRGLEWVRPWFFSLPVTSPIEVVLPFCVTFAAWIILLRSNRRSGQRCVGPAKWLLLPMLAGVAFWLWAGPEPRYGWQTMWALAAMSVALAAMTIETPRPIWMRRFIFVMIALAVPAVIYRAGVAAFLRHGNPLAEIPFLPPGSDHGFHPKPVQTFKLIQTRWGTSIYVPDREGQPLAWDGPIPCTAWPTLDMDARLRWPNDLGSGFVTDHGH